MSTIRRPVLVAHLLLLAVVIVWGTTFSLVKAALADISPLLFNLLRMAFAASILLLLYRRSLTRLTRREVRLGALAGLFLALGYQLQTLGLARTAPSKSAFLTGMVVVIVPFLSLLARVSARDTSPVGRDALIGALVAFAGILLLTEPPHARLLNLFSGFGLGETLSLLCAVAFAAHLLAVGHAAKLVNARRLGTLQITFAALIMLVTLPLGGWPHLHLTAAVCVALGLTAVLATAAAFTIQSWAQQHLPAAHTALLFTLEPVFAGLTAWGFFGEQLGLRAICGAGLILLGILIAELQLTSHSPPLPLAGA